MTQRQVETSDGRTLAVEDAGDPGGPPVLVHVGTPGGRRLYGPRTLADAERRKLRLIGYDRPGYGADATGAELALLTDEAVSMQQALAPGIEGAWDDCVAQLSPWGWLIAHSAVRAR